jgi:hypothetical protein
MNVGRIVRDENHDVFLKVDGKNLDHTVYFLINCYDYDDVTEEKLVNLSNKFIIDLENKKGE